MFYRICLKWFSIDPLNNAKLSDIFLRLTYKHTSPILSGTAFLFFRKINYILRYKVYFQKACDFATPHSHVKNTVENVEVDRIS